ncbi:MAG: UDP-N-acetylmuramate dehydrogenase [Bacteroidales bacterium]|nr:UDP-N-acetylmuramate dehydrogenase [Bacteroidales bacterium]
MPSIIHNADLSARNTFRMKVRCAALVEIDSEEDLLEVDFASLPQPLMVMGGGSNLLFRGDFPGTVLHVGIKGIEASPAPDDAVYFRVGAGEVFDDFCAFAAAKGLWGPENLSLIPGECGASAVQNIGAYGVEAKNIIESIRAWDTLEKRFVDIQGADCAYGYRASRFKTEWKGRYIITYVTYRLWSEPHPVLDYGGLRKSIPADTPLTPQLLRETIIGIRRKKLPDPEETGSAGSFFCNPVITKEHFARIVDTARRDNGPEYEVPHYVVGDMIKVPAAWMIEQCGFKGHRLGGAQVYQNQPLVIVNASGSASPEEIIGLENKIIATIREKYGITLHPEVEHI